MLPFPASAINSCRWSRDLSGKRCCCVAPAQTRSHTVSVVLAWYRRRTYLHRSVSHLAALLQLEPKAIEAAHNWSGPDTSNLTRVISAAGGDDSLGIAECWIRHEEMEA
jgi:hypothetical protein